MSSAHDGGTAALGPGAAPGATAPAPARSHEGSAEGVYGDYVSMRPRARVLGALLVAAALVCWIAVGFDVADYRLLERQLAGYAVGAEAKSAYRAIGSVISAVQFVLVAAAAFAFVEWLYQSRINLRAFGVRRLRYRRSWAVAGFFVPFLNLFRPYQVVREVWQASDPGVLDPFAWTQVRVGWLPRVWWAAVVVSSVALLTAWAMGAGAGLEAGKLQSSRAVATLGDFAAAFAVSLGFFLVDHVSNAQEEKWRRAPRVPPAEAPKAKAG